MNWDTPHAQTTLNIRRSVGEAWARLSDRDLRPTRLRVPARIYADIYQTLTEIDPVSAERPTFLGLALEVGEPAVVLPEPDFRGSEPVHLPEL